jgi:hypothetical protein
MPTWAVPIGDRLGYPVNLLYNEGEGYVESSNLSASCSVRPLIGESISPHGRRI